MSNEILESLMIGSFSKRELLVLLYVFRNGYGYNHEQSACKLNTNHIAIFTHLDRSHVNKTLHLLEGKGVLKLEEDEIRFNRHANEWTMAKTATEKVRPKQPRIVAKTATDCSQNSHREGVIALTVNDIQPPKEKLKKKETPISPESGDCIPLISSEQEIEQIVVFLNEATGKVFRPSTKGTQRLIKARLSEGFTVEDFKHVIKEMSRQWKGDKKMDRFLRPETLFGVKFEGYLQESVKTTITHTAHGFNDPSTGIRGYGF